MSTPQPLLSREQEQGLRGQLCAEDVVGASFLFRVYYLPLVEWLRERNRRLDNGLLEEAAEQAITALIADPRTYNPERCDLFGYLRLAAAGDLKNLLRKEGRHHRHRKPWNVVEKAEADGNGFGEIEGPPALLQQAEEALAADEFLRTCSSGWTAEEKQVLELMRCGETTTEALARVLGIEDLPFAEQQETANRVKDRLLKRLQREGSRA